MPVVAAPWRRGRETAGAAEAFVSHTVFRYDRWRDLPAISRDAERAARLWARQPGALWLRQWVLPTGRLMGDLSVWRRADDLASFLVLPEHLALMAHWRSRMRGEHHSWAVEHVDRRSIWDAALELTTTSG